MSMGSLAVHVVLPHPLMLVSASRGGQNLEQLLCIVSISADWKSIILLSSRAQMSYLSYMSTFGDNRSPAQPNPLFHHFSQFSSHHKVPSTMESQDVPGSAMLVIVRHCD